MIFVNYIAVFATFASLSLYAVDAASLKIIGGQDADIKDFPYMAHIKMWYGIGFLELMCGATILDEFTLLTAAHCFFDVKPEDLVIVYGTANQSELVFTSKVAKIIMHEDFETSGEWSNDIALVKVDPPMVLGEVAKAAKLPEANAPNPEKQTANLTGWGVVDVSIGGNHPEILQRIEVTVVPDKECKDTWDNATTVQLTMESKLCAVPDTSDGNLKGACALDAGGPLVVDGVQYGIVSFYYRYCGNPEAPPVFTKVSHYIDWISKNL